MRPLKASFLLFLLSGASTILFVVHLTIGTRKVDSVSRVRETRPYLSFIVAARNAAYSLSPPHVLERFQLCLDILGTYVEEYGLSLEIIVVEWDPPEGTSFAREIRWHPRLMGKVVRVEGEILKKIPSPTKQDVLEYVGKNVGARRATGEYLWFGSTDNILSPMFGWWLSRRPLQPSCFYDRPSIRPGCNVSLVKTRQVQDVLEHCFGTELGRKKNVWDVQEVRSNPIRSHLPGKRRVPFGEIVHPRTWNTRAGGPQTGASGDFTIVHRDAFHFVHGYTEVVEKRSHIDSSLYWALSGAGYCEITLPQALFIVQHYDHDRRRIPAPSGVKEKPKPRGLSLKGYLKSVKKLYEAYGAIPLGANPNWGLKQETLPETSIM